MRSLIDSPLALFTLSFVALSLCAWLGSRLRARESAPAQEGSEDEGIVLAAALTLLGLIIGFSFSMAVTRYDLRKTLEEAEANAIGTEYLRADLLPASDRDRTRLLLKSYLEQRMSFYTSRDEARLGRINAQTERLQAQLWSTAHAAAVAAPNAVIALAVAGMNDVLNAQGYTQAAWWNQIPAGAWTLMALIALICSTMVGHATGQRAGRRVLLLILPLLLSIAFALIADIDSPRRGLIPVAPQNLRSLADALR